MQLQEQRDSISQGCDQVFVPLIHLAEPSASATMSILSRIADLLEKENIGVEHHRNKLIIPVRCGALGTKIDISQRNGVLQVLVSIPYVFPVFDWPQPVKPWPELIGNF
jgi:hypothetical protein